MGQENLARIAIANFMTEVREDLNRRLQALTAGLLGAAGGRSPASSRDLQRAADEIARAVGAGRTADGGADVVARLLGAIRDLDVAASLSDILEALGRGAALEAERAAVLLVDGDTLRSWRHFGYTEDLMPVDIPRHSYRALERAVEGERRLALTPPAQGAALDVPAFMQVLPGRSGVVLPIAIGGQVAALLFAEGEDRRPGGMPIWLEQVEILARHAASRLENVTSFRTVEVLAGSG